MIYKEKEIIFESFVKWLVLLGIGIIDVIWICVGDFHFNFRTATAPPVLCSIFVISAWTCLLWRKQTGLFVLCDTIAQFILLCGVGGTLSYLVLSTDLPLVDRYLSDMDYALGFDWPHFVLWIQAHPYLDLALQFVYGGWILEWILVPLALCYRNEERVRELSGAILIAVIITFAVSSLLPAISAYPYYESLYPALVPEMDVRDLFGLREGTLRVIDLATMGGLVSFPSFHVAVAVLFSQAIRGKGFATVMGTIYNIAVIFSTLSAGGHYLTDAIGGGAIAAFSIYLYRGIVGYAALRTLGGPLAPSLDAVIRR